MNENLPIRVQEMQSDGVISYANDVIAIIAGMAVNEVDGVASMINTNAIADLFNRGKPITRGVKVEVGVEEASVDIVLTVDYGKPIQKVCIEVQESVRKAIETMTGLHVVKVDVHVMGVSFERETKEMAQGYVNATTAQKTLDETNAWFGAAQAPGGEKCGEEPPVVADDQDGADDAMDALLDEDDTLDDDDILDEDDTDEQMTSSDVDEALEE